MRHSNVYRLIIFLMLIVFAFPAAAQSNEDSGHSKKDAAQSNKDKDKDKKKKSPPTGTPVLWREPVDIQTRNLLLGAGGEAMKPNLSKVTFVEERTGGTSKKYLVTDGSGNKWVAKLGKESQSDTSANRLLWAVGYETEIAYLIPRLTIEGKGTFENVRLEARPKAIDRAGDWKWENNPFTGKPEFQGLKVMMVLINNWDIKDSNNEILATRNEATGQNELRYIISDLGGSFGKTGGFFARTRNKVSDFVEAPFIENVKGNVIDFNYGGKNQKLFTNITVEDAKWIGRYLARLSNEQIKDAFRAANYSSQDVDAYSSALRQRIDALNNASNAVASRP